MNDEEFWFALPRDVPDYHARQAAHWRALAENATTPGIKTRLLAQAEGHEALAVADDAPG